ncbi:unnamed protein product [Prorocentrum cordatum]|uniref:Uncharacterized protein n=1 Tax=Prorocentrum cordatum TaxID=2364126 RepID=A0ABN9QV94_9DINO|nr:unnamed protein product [Polarella glacialis]
MFGRLGVPDALLDGAREALRSASVATLVWVGQGSQSCPACPDCPSCPEVSCPEVAVDLGKWRLVAVLLAGLAGLAAGCCARPIAPARLVLVRYGGGEAYWHERLLLCKVEGTTWVIAAPDGDVCPEDIYGLNGKPCCQGSIPPSIPANALLYRFAPLGQMHTPAEWRQIFEDGIATAQMERAIRGIDDAAADADSGAVRDRVALHVWTADAGLPGGPPAAAGGAGDVAVVPVAAGPPGLGGPPPLPLAAALLAGGLAAAGGGAAVPLAGGPLGADAPPGAAAPAHRQWIVVANDGQPGAPAVGADWSVDASAVIVGNFALVKLGCSTLVLKSIDVGSKQLKLVARRGELEQATDARVLPVLYDQMGQRFRSFVDAVGLLEEPRFTDFPIQGPRAEKWMRDAHVPDNDRVKHEHSSLMEILEYALTYDLGEILFEAWRMVASVTYYLCQGWARLKSHVALSVVEFSSVFVVVRGLTGASARQSGPSMSLEGLAAHRTVVLVESRLVLLLLWSEMLCLPCPCLASGPLRMKPSRRFCVQALATETASAPGTLHRLVWRLSRCRAAACQGWISTSSSEQAVYSASFDIEDYFHELRIDEDLSQYFALPAVRASAVGVESIDGVKVDARELIYPALQSLPMGFSWAMWAAQLVEAMHLQALEGARKAGFHVHEIERVSASLDVISVHLDGEREMRAILGHLCFAFLLRRPCLSCVAASFAFAESTGDDCKNLWPSVKRGRLLAAAILPLVYADIAAGWLDQVQEGPAAQAQEAALAGYDVAEPPVDRGGNLAADSDEGAWLAVGDFPDVEPAAVKEAKWAVVAKRPCGSHEGTVHVKEARGAKLGLKHVVRCGRWRHRKVLMRVDNMGLALALQKGRCRDPALLGQFRQMAALQLATGLRAQFRWIPSEVNPADRPMPGGVTTREVAHRIEISPATHMVSLETRLRGQQPLADEGSGPSEQASLPRPPAMPAERPGGSRRSRATTSTRQAAARRSASSGGLSYLESIAVRLVQVEDYHRRIEEFYGFVLRQGLSTCTLDAPEAALLSWAGDPGLEGRKKHDGGELKAAVLLYCPSHKRTNTGPLARFERCLKAWEHRRPAMGRLPPPYTTMCGLAVGPPLQNHTDTAVAVLVALSAYLRPGELRGLRVRGVAPPARGCGAERQRWSLALGPSDGQGNPTKTGVCDDNVTIDHESLQLLGHFFEGVGKAMARCGISSLEVEIQSGLDLLAPGVMAALLKLVSSGRAEEAPRDEGGGMSQQGKVKLFKVDKGFGFITAKDGTDVFLLGKFCVDGGVPQKGDVVRYDVEPSSVDPKKFQAVNVTGGTGVLLAPEDSGAAAKEHKAEDNPAALVVAKETSDVTPEPPCAKEGSDTAEAASAEAADGPERPCAGGFGSIRAAYGELGSGGYYEAHGEEYTNPHEPALKRALVTAFEAWEPLLEPPVRRVHDLACGSGEASVAFGCWRGSAGCALDASDPYTHAAFENRLGRPCRRWSFEDVAAGVLEEEQPYDLVLASFCLHLLEKSYLHTTLAALARSCRLLAVATPHKRPDIEGSTGWRLRSELVHERIRMRLYESDGARRLEEGEAIAENKFIDICSAPEEQDDQEEALADARDVEEVVARMGMEGLRAAAIERGLSTAGTRGEVAARLAVALREELDADGAAEEEEEPEDDLEELVAAMNLAELRKALAERGLSAEGRRAQLAERLLAALAEAQGESAEELVEAMSAAQMRSALAARGLGTSGRRAELAARLLEAMAEDEEGEESEADGAAEEEEEDAEGPGASKKEKKRLKEQRKREKEQKAQAAARALEEKKLRESERRKERRRCAKQGEPQEDLERERPPEGSRGRKAKQKNKKETEGCEPDRKEAEAGDDAAATLRTEGGRAAEEVVGEGDRRVGTAEEVAGEDDVATVGSAATPDAAAAPQGSEIYVWADPLPADAAAALAEMGVAPGARVTDVELAGVVAEGGPDVAVACGLIMTLSEAVRRKKQLRDAEVGGAGLRADGGYAWGDPLPADSAEALAAMGVVAGARVSEVELQGILAEGGPGAAIACGLIRPVWDDGQRGEGCRENLGGLWFLLVSVKPPPPGNPSALLRAVCAVLANMRAHERWTSRRAGGVRSSCC